jgi:hypothetical protein
MLGNKLGIWGTCFKISGDLMGIMKIQQPPPFPKEKELGPLGACWPISLVAIISMPIFLSYDFWHRLMARAQIVGHNQNNDSFHPSKGPFTLKCNNMVKLEL